MLGQFYRGGGDECLFFNHSNIFKSKFLQANFCFKCGKLNQA